MQPSTLLLALTTTFGLTSAVALPETVDTSLDKRRCFTSGIKFGAEKSAAIGAAESVCKNNLRGRYLKGERYSKCKPMGTNKSVVFHVGLSGDNAPASRELGYEECLSGLMSEINNCGRGGQTTYGRWYYRVDPNDGDCQA